MGLARGFRAMFPHLSLGIAGGLGGDMFYKTAQILKKLMPISVGAESGLALNGLLDMKCVSRYLREILRIHGITCGRTRTK